MKVMENDLFVCVVVGSRFGHVERMSPGGYWMVSGRGERQPTKQDQVSGYDRLYVRCRLTCSGNGTRSAKLIFHSSSTFHSGLPLSSSNCSFSLPLPLLFAIPSASTIPCQSSPTLPQTSILSLWPLRSVHLANSFFDCGSIVKEGFVDGR